MRWLKGNLFCILLFAAMMGILLYGFSDAQQNSKEEGYRMVEESLRRAVISCYALEGSYPCDLEYIYDRYGVRVDEDKYIVHYEIFAANIMPDITVIER